MYVQSLSLTPPLVGARRTTERAVAKRDEVYRGAPSAAGPPSAVADRRDRDEPSSREVFSTNWVAKPRAIAHVTLAEKSVNYTEDNALRCVFIFWIDKSMTGHNIRAVPKVIFASS